MTDESLMLCVKNDDLHKAGILYERYERKIYHYFLYKDKYDTERSQDDTQQVFYRMIRYRKTYKDGSNFSMWIYGIARNIRNDNLRAELKKKDMQFNYPIEETYSPFNDEEQALHQALQMLQEPYREVLVMSKFLGLKYEEIAEMCNCSEGVIKTRVFRAMQYLKDIYLKII